MLGAEKKEIISEMCSAVGVDCVHPISALVGTGIDDLKIAACNTPLEKRVDAKLARPSMGRYVGRLQVTMPAARDSKARGVCIPDSVRAAHADSAPVSVADMEPRMLKAWMKARKAERRPA